MNVDEIAKNFTGETAMPFGIDTVIKTLRPGAKWDVTVAGGEYTFTRWQDDSGQMPPTKQEIDKEYAFQKAQVDYYQYAYDRCHNYPDGFEQLDLLWHAVNEGKDLKESEWFQKIKEVKDKYPKPEGGPPVKE